MVLRRFHKNDAGMASVEFALLSGFLIAVTLAALELGYGYMQYNQVQQAARTGARLAAVSDPVASDMRNMTGLGSAGAGDPMPAYTRICSGSNQRCSGGTYDGAAMAALIFGPDRRRRRRRRHRCRHRDRLCCPKSQTGGRRICAARLPDGFGF